MFGNRFTGEVPILFERKTAGLFLVVKPVLDEGEVFDSNSLRERVSSLVAEGQRNIALDFSGLSYLYSDTMNVLFNLNRQILDSNGRLAIVGPTPDVAQILHSAGIYNFIKVYNTDAELQKSSEEIILQTSGFSLAALQQQAGITHPQKPKSEFEDLRAGIEASMAIPDPQMRQGPAVHPPAAQVPPAFGVRPPVAQQPLQPHPVTRPQPQPQYAPPPPPPTKIRRAAQPAPAPAAYPEPEPVRKAPEPVDLDFPKEKRKSPVVAIVISVVAVAALAGGVAFFAPMLLNGGKETPGSTMSATRPTPPAPPTPAPPPPPPAVPKDTTPTVASPSPASEGTQVASSNPPVERGSRARSTGSSSHGSRVERTTPPPAPPSPPPASTRPASPPPAENNRIVIATDPSGAMISVDGKLMGVSPYTWMEPKPRGTMKLEASKDGYTTKTEMVEYTGGEKVVALKLALESKPTPPPPTPAPTPPPTTTTTTAAATPTPPPATPTPPPSTPPEATASSGGASGSPGTVFISSIPPVADVYMDGKLIGKTNISKLNILSGKHTMKFAKGPKEHTVEMTFSPGENQAKHVTF